MSHIPPSPAPGSPLSGLPPIATQLTTQPEPNTNAEPKTETGLQTPRPIETAPENSAQWKTALTYLSRRIKKQSFATWLTPTRGVVRTLSGGERVMEIFVSNLFVAEWLRENYLALIEEALRETSGEELGALFSVRENASLARQTEIPFDEPGRVSKANGSDTNFSALESQTSANLNGATNAAASNGHYQLTSGAQYNSSPTVTDPRLSERYRFTGLVVGAFNEFAYAAAQAVAERPGATKYNPLFFYGGVGLGKTHLAQSIGQAAREKFPGTKIKYATSEEFTNDFIYSLSNSTTGAFANSYRSVDILLIDDIQFFSGKESTQEQFFHTFNALYNSGKQIVLTADRPPQEIKGLEERLLSRFSSGLVADIQTPDLEARVAILRKKMSEHDFQVDEEALLYIASRITSNVRELEGALTRLYARASVNRRSSVDLSFTEQALSDILNARPKRATVESIQRVVASAFDVECEALKGKKRTAHLALARQAAMYLTRNLTDHSLQKIGQDFGGRDHSTVIHACTLIESKMESDLVFKQRLDDITEDCI